MGNLGLRLFTVAGIFSVGGLLAMLAAGFAVAFGYVVGVFVGIVCAVAWVGFVLVTVDS